MNERSDRRLIPPCAASGLRPLTLLIRKVARQGGPGNRASPIYVGQSPTYVSASSQQGTGLRAKTVLSGSPAAPVKSLGGPARRSPLPRRGGGVRRGSAPGSLRGAVVRSRSSNPGQKLSWTGSVSRHSQEGRASFDGRRISKRSTAAWGKRPLGGRGGLSVAGPLICPSQVLFNGVQ